MSEHITRKNNKASAQRDFNVVWFKRDLRLRDHQALFEAQQASLPIVLLYIVEPFMLNDPHMDIRHWRFIYQSIDDINTQLFNELSNDRPLISGTGLNNGAKMCILHGDALEIFKRLQGLGLNAIYSHQEIGLQHSFERDKRITSWAIKEYIKWYEYAQGAVKRPLAHRFQWREHWHQIMSRTTYDPRLSELDVLSLPAHVLHQNQSAVPQAWQEANANFQKGGEKRAWHILYDFFHERGKGYFGNIGKPTEARKTCSRLSPYLAWGNISIRQVYQFSQRYQNQAGWKRSVNAFQARISWHCHFIQKFESECDMEHRAVNRGYADYPYCSGDIADARLQAWKTGTTGVPIIDASMRAVIQTGYLNLRMRAMLVSFLCHHLDIDWREGVNHLGRQFLDFEPVTVICKIKTGYYRKFDRMNCVDKFCILLNISANYFKDTLKIISNSFTEGGVVRC